MLVSSFSFFPLLRNGEDGEETILEIQPLSSAPVRIQTLSLAWNLRATRICHSGESLRKKELHACFAFLFLFFSFLHLFSFLFFFRALAYSISAKNNNYRSVTLPSRQDIVFKFSATWTERAARNSGCKRAGIVAPYTPFLLESRTCSRGFCSWQKAANNK